MTTTTDTPTETPDENGLDASAIAAAEDTHDPAEAAGADAAPSDAAEWAPASQGNGEPAAASPVLRREDLERKDMDQLKTIASQYDIRNRDRMKRGRLIDQILREVNGEVYVNDSGEPPEAREGVLDILPENYGFLRCTGYLPGEKDVYVSVSQVRRFGLRRGDHLIGSIRPPRNQEKYPALLHVVSINGKESFRGEPRPEF